MLKNITWSQFAVFAIALTFVYYGYVLVRFFFKDLKSKLFNKSIAIADDTTFFEAEQNNPGPGLQPIENFTGEQNKHEKEDGQVSDQMQLLPTAHELADELKTLAEDVGKRKLIKDETVFAFRQLLNQPSYNALKDSAFREALDEMILEELQNHCGILLEPQELTSLWNG